MGWEGGGRTASAKKGPEVGVRSDKPTGFKSCGSHREFLRV